MLLIRSLTPATLLSCSLLSLLLAFGSAPVVAAIDMVCELKIKKVSANATRVAQSLHLETYNTDPEREGIWFSLFDVIPQTSLDDELTLQADKIVVWQAGTLTMGGDMKLKVKTDKKAPSLKTIKIEKVRKNHGRTDFISGTGGVNPNLAHGGWHEVKITNLDNVTVYFGSAPVSGFLKELKVKLDSNSTTGSPIVREFKLKLKGATAIADVKNGLIASVIIDVPQTIVTALATIEYKEKVKDKPKILNGHTEAEFDWNENDPLGVDIGSLTDGSNEQLKERIGSCTVAEVSLNIAEISFFSARDGGDGTAPISWNTTEESEIAVFIVEKNTDAGPFRQVAVFAARGAGSTYITTDLTTEIGHEHTYRLIVVFKDDTILELAQYTLDIK